MSDLSFTHLDPLGRARMVDVTPKEATHRRAVARCKVVMKPETTLAIANREVKKGDVLSVARVAGIQAAKRTSDMIPLCHPLLVGSVSVNFDIGDDYVAVEAQVDTVDRTGVEMEALHACAMAALTIYDMCKSADRGMVIGELTLWEKTGGRTGTYRRPTSAPVPDGASDTASAATPEATSDGVDGVGAPSHPPAHPPADESSDVSEDTTVVASSAANVVES
ncbi:MAG TPA: cyclic pyranopterin monophosphate synthase MoaC [Ilumatobacteraceae bacterium]|nr:cyclic pyranopterin monophosphate synthase MoaC [Ilumatobacteraceae bacterium]